MAAGQPEAIEVIAVGGNISQGIDLTSANDGSNRLFVIQQTGEIRIWDGNQTLPTPFLDLDPLTNGGGEQGLLGLVFHPDYETNGFFYVNYTDLAGDTVVARYQVSANPNIADAASAQTVLTFNQTAGNHNGGDMHFGADGMLYISSGDGGLNPFDSQDNATLLGNLLRIDVNSDDFPGNPDRNYAIPADNPLVGVSGAAPEIWVSGLRNPWRFSFDRLNGDLFIGDVGEDQWEEINWLAAGGVGGENFGWPCFEGDEVAFTGPQCQSPGAYVLPIIQLPHASPPANNCSVIGGYRYRGAQFTGMQGWYFYSDWCTGVLWAARDDGGGWQSFEVGSVSPFTVTGYAEDENGELFAVGGEQIFQIVSTPELIFEDGFES
ncbi:MAG: PQQ-dependent sugar dehydrogenase [Wenzhouxiangellaceae bacterium]